MAKLTYFSALKNRGVQPVLQGVINYLPDPSKNSKFKLRSISDGKEQIIDSKRNTSLVGLAFKALNHETFGPLTYIKVYSGKLQKGKPFFNVNKGEEEKALNIFRVQADQYKKVNEISTGDIAAVSGLKITRSGDTLVQREQPTPKLLDGVIVPEPVFLTSLELEHSKNENKLYTALDILTIEDPSFLYEKDTDTGQLVIKGLGELHLQIMKDRLNTEFNIPSQLTKLRVAYKEAAFGYNDLSEQFLQKIKGSMEFFELEGSVEPIDQYLEEDSDEEGSQKNSSFKNQLKEGDQIYSNSKNVVTILLPDNNEIELSFFEDETCASFFSEYSKLKYQAERAKNQTSENSVKKSQNVNTAYKSMFNTTKEEQLDEIVDIAGQDIPKYDIRSLNFENMFSMVQIVVNSLQRGPLLSKSMINTKIIISGGKYTQQYTSGIMIEASSNKFIHKLLQDCSPGIMEPVMDIDIFVPQEHQQSVMNDFLGVRKGKVEDVLAAELTGNKRGHNTVRGVIPSENSIGYANQLRSMTSVRIFALKICDFFMSLETVC